MKKSIACSLLAILILIPLTLYLGTQLEGRSYYLISTLIVLETMLPFFLVFESRKPQARELVIIAVMCALATASRVVIPIPNFKPITAIIMITGIAFGPEAGFLTGAVSAFASNFFFSQGPWTPWQMMSYGISGFLAGLFFRNPGALPRKRLWILCSFAFLCVLLVTGPLLDCCTIFTTSAKITKKYILAVFSAGLPYNLIHASASAVTMLLFAGPLLEKLDRMKRKYGMMDGSP